MILWIITRPTNLTGPVKTCFDLLSPALLSSSSLLSLSHSLLLLHCLASSPTADYGYTHWKEPSGPGARQWGRKKKVR